MKTNKLYEVGYGRVREIVLAANPDEAVTKAQKATGITWLPFVAKPIRVEGFDGIETLCESCEEKQLEIDELNEIVAEQKKKITELENLKLAYIESDGETNEYSQMEHPMQTVDDIELSVPAPREERQIVDLCETCKEDCKSTIPVEVCMAYRKRETEPVIMFVNDMPETEEKGVEVVENTVPKNTARGGSVKKAGKPTAKA